MNSLSKNQCCEMCDEFGVCCCSTCTCHSSEKEVRYSDAMKAAQTILDSHMEKLQEHRRLSSKPLYIPASQKEPCTCPKGGVDGDGRICQKCHGTEWIDKKEPFEQFMNSPAHEDIIRKAAEQGAADQNAKYAASQKELAEEESWEERLGDWIGDFIDYGEDLDGGYWQHSLKEFVREVRSQAIEAERVRWILAITHLGMAARDKVLATYDEKSALLTKLEKDIQEEIANSDKAFEGEPENQR